MITGYLGDFGSGKTLNMVWDLIQAMYHGRKVISNTPIELLYDPLFSKKVYLKAEFIAEGDKFQWALEHRENCILAIDEAAVYLPSTYWNKLPPALIVKFAQQRKYRTDFFYTSQVYAHSVKRLRDLTHRAYLCRRRMITPTIYFPFKQKIINKDNGEVWYRKRRINGLTLFIAKKFIPAFFHGEQSQKKYERYYLGQRILYPSQVRRVFKAYDTNYVVDMSAMMKVKGFEQPQQYKEGTDEPIIPIDTTSSVSEEE